ncbi:hypothetical protein SCHPADRAFT_73877 [Schizopora paradoxa]|uniref:Uncharacterized protein n=1 Tax=Schizopora paradoxa TaxID=27342 RepID=A0A0H2SC95_9AGAM|nr:hypothetical protein SCHPADRAFT_73877 [Schizopora paradoxa]
MFASPPLRSVLFYALAFFFPVRDPRYSGNSIVHLFHPLWRVIVHTILRSNLLFRSEALRPAIFFPTLRTNRALSSCNHYQYQHWLADSPCPRFRRSTQYHTHARTLEYPPPAAPRAPTSLHPPGSSLLLFSRNFYVSIRTASYLPQSFANVQRASVRSAHTFRIRINGRDVVGTGRWGLCATRAMLTSPTDLHRPRYTTCPCPETGARGKEKNVHQNMLPEVLEPFSPDVARIGSGSFA